MAKTKIICDTDVLIDYLDVTKERHDRTKFILNSQIHLNNVVLSAVTVMELLVGARNKREEVKINKSLSRFNIALINNEITNEAIFLLQSYRLSHGLSIPDCLIAATAKVTGLELFSYNIKDYRFIKALKLFPIR